MTRKTGTRSAAAPAPAPSEAADAGAAATDLGQLRKEFANRRQAEHRLRERERFLRTLIGNLPGVVYRCRCDESWTSEFVSEGCVELTGYTVDELTGRRTTTWEQIIHPADRERVRAEARRLVRDLAPLRLTYRIVARDGTEKVISDRSRPVTDASGAVVALEGFIIDITARVRAQEAEREADRRYRLLAENMHDMICLHDAAGRFTYVSPTSERLLGYTPEELCGKEHLSFVHSEDAPCVSSELFERLRAGDTGFTVECRLVRKDGSHLWVETMAQIVRDLEGAPAQYLTSTRDITERKSEEIARRLAEEEQARLHLLEQAARQKSERADRVKDEFIQMISHEFRTPLTTIKTLVRVMQHGGETDDERHEYLETIASECDRQIDMILNILDLARYEEGALDLRHEPTDAAAVVRACDRIERHAAEARRQRFETVIAPDLPPIRSDAKALRRALCSIIENAIKYTPDGGAITLAAAREPREIETAPGVVKKVDEVAISISDTGRGIHPEDLPRVFNKFFRGRSLAPHDATTDGTYDDAHGRAETPGVGLGLYLAHRLIEALEGHIEVESTPHVGSRFTVRLPVWRDSDSADAQDQYGGYTAEDSVGETAADR